MNAVTFHASVARYLLARSLGRVADTAVFGALSGVSYGELPEPGLPGDEWVSLDVMLAGIGDSDVAALTYRTGPALEPFGSLSAVPGHEILARVREVGPAVTRVEPGQRIVVDPVLSCTVRGFGEDPCESCANGLAQACERASEEGALEVDGEPLAPGGLVGFHRQLPGGWGERTIAHQDQLHAVDEGLDDRTAVLTEPLSIGVHAVLGMRIDPDQPVLVIGSGAIAMGTVWALRATGFSGYLLAETRRPHEAGLARRLGATETAAPGDEAREALTGTGARELRVRGFVGYGRERWRGAERHTFEVTMALLSETDAPVAEIVTHVFPLEQYRDGLSAAAHHKRSEAVKVLLRP